MPPMSAPKPASSRPSPTAELLTHFCLDGDAVLLRRDRKALIFLGKCEICDGLGRNCQICGWEHAETLTPMGGPICPECLEQLQ
jgi:hypothetical protein